jgi:phosphopantothenoylcysteine decarboxylase/phosphopantothenate--cysteine ligase
VGFAAEHGRKGNDRARAKLERKRLDAIVFNDVSREEIGFDSEENEVTVVTEQGETAITKRAKDEVAAALLDQLQELRGVVRARSTGAGG